jgi:hypothetical protein
MVFSMGTKIQHAIYYFSALIVLKGKYYFSVFCSPRVRDSLTAKVIMIVLAYPLSHIVHHQQPVRDVTLARGKIISE